MTTRTGPGGARPDGIGAIVARSDVLPRAYAVEGALALVLAFGVGKLRFPLRIGLLLTR
jgi:hypothetical protein